MKGLDPIPQSEWHQSQRGYFAGALYNQMLENKDIVLLTGDLGYKVWDRIRDDMPDRFFNLGAAEHSLMCAAVGMALEGKIPFVYSITPFLLFRPAEVIRNYVNKEKIPVKLIGSGRGEDYSQHDGFSHFCGDDQEILRLFPNIKGRWPPTKEEIPDLVEDMILREEPMYLNLSR